jgi:hypothetical protein
MKKSDSESERDEDHKRKREEGRESEERINPFRKSKKVERSPVKKAMDQEMKKMLEKIMEDVGEIKEENRKMSRELEQLKSMMREKEEKWEREKMELKEKMTKLEEKMEEQEKRVRKKNIVVTGLDEEECENEKKLEKWMKAELEVEVRVKEMYKINGGKMIVAELESWGEKRKVMENKRKLREKKGKRVYIEDDMTKKERDTQKKLRTLAKEEREKGLPVKVGYKKIWIEGKGFRWDEENGKLHTANF